MKENPPVVTHILDFGCSQSRLNTPEGSVLPDVCDRGVRIGLQSVGGWENNVGLKTFVYVL